MPHGGESNPVRHPQLVGTCRKRVFTVYREMYSRHRVERLSQLRVSGLPVRQFGGNHDDRGFTYTAWVPLPLDKITSDGLTFELGWPEVEHAVHQVQGIGDAVASIVRLWSE